MRLSTHTAQAFQRPFLAERPGCSCHIKNLRSFRIITALSGYPSAGVCLQVFSFRSPQFPKRHDRNGQGTRFASCLPRIPLPDSLCDTNLHSPIGFPLKGAPVSRIPAPVICFPFQRRLHRRSRKETPAGRLHPFGSGQIWNPYPPYYRAAFASSGILYPHIRGLPLRFAFPSDSGRCTGFPCSAQVPSEQVRSHPYAGGATSAMEELEAPIPGRLPFWFKPFSTFGLFS